MPQVVLNEPGVGALVSQSEAAGMAQHVRVRRQGESRLFAITTQQGPESLA